jgi:DNA-directed RNA polymerase III subunit RPC1
MAQPKKIVDVSSAPKKIAKIQFGTLNTSSIQKYAEFQVASRELFKMPQRTPAPFGCLDTRLGISDKLSSCQTCK